MNKNGPVDWNGLSLDTQSRVDRLEQRVSLHRMMLMLAMLMIIILDFIAHREGHRITKLENTWGATHVQQSLMMRVELIERGMSSPVQRLGSHDSAEKRQ